MHAHVTAAAIHPERPQIGPGQCCRCQQERDDDDRADLAPEREVVEVNNRRSGREPHAYPRRPI